MKHLSSLALVALLLVSCASHGPNNTASDQTSPPAVDQTIGHRTSATLTSAATGTLLSVIVGQEMTPYDREQLNHAYERGISHHRASWVNPDTGHQFTVTPQPAYQNPATQGICRRAEIEAVLSGKPQQLLGTACRAASGSWHVQ